jgi:PAS domain S-box-containing protein
MPKKISTIEHIPLTDTDAWVRYIPLPAYVTDKNGFILSFNEEAVALWGRRPEPGIDRWSGAYKLYAVDGAPLTSGSTPAAQAIERGRPEQSRKMIIERPDLTKRLVMSFVKLIYEESGGVVYSVTTLTDLGALTIPSNGEAEGLREEVRASAAAFRSQQNQLLQSEDRYHKMIAEVTDYAILLLDEYGVIQNWNSGAEKIKGYQESEIVGRHFRVFYTLQKRRRREKPCMKDGVSGKTTPYSGEALSSLRFTMKRGRW